MKKILFLVALSLFSISMQSQKKKTVKKAAPKTTSNVIAKADNLTAELVKNNFYIFINNGRTKDTILLKNFETARTPADCKITPFKAKGAPLYCISWIEKNVLDTKLKNEETTTTFSEIWNIAEKKQILANNQTTTKITEIVFLDKNKTVSETQQKMRREGFELTITPEGDIILKNKTQENKMTYDVAKQQYVNASTPKKNK